MGISPLLISVTVIVSQVIPIATASSNIHPHHLSNGVIKLIIEGCSGFSDPSFVIFKTMDETEFRFRELFGAVSDIKGISCVAYTEDVLREMESQPGFQLSASQYALLRQRLRDLYDHIRHHPALHQRYLWVGKGRPDIDPDIGAPLATERQRHRGSSKRKRYLIEESSSEQSEDTATTTMQTHKKSKASFPAEEICKTNRLWEQINNTHDFYDNEVEVVQDNVQQYVFSYRCVAETGPCIGISPLYDSECTERYGWMYMYYRRLDDPYRIPQWGFVAAPHHCACKITPKYIPDS